MKKRFALALALVCIGWVAFAEVLNYPMPTWKSEPVLSAVEMEVFASHASGWLKTKESLGVDTVRIAPAPLRPLYEKEQFRPLWSLPGGRLSQRAEAVLATLARADTHGLPAARYDLDALQALRQRMRASQTPSPPDWVALDAMVTRALLRYVEDMSPAGKPARRVPKELRDTWPPPRDPAEITAEIIACVDVSKCLQARAPTNPHYGVLQQKLFEYHALEALGGWPKFPSGAKLEPGKSDPRVPTLRQALVKMGDGAPELLQLSSDVYDAHTVEAFKAFQRRHGLNPDGVVGRQGEAALAVPVKERIAAIRASLAEWRRLPHDLGNKYLWVNIPAFQLQGFEDGRQVVGMRIVVGQADEKWQTPMFSNVVKWVIFNPHWTVPKSIASEELLGKIQEDPEFFDKGDYKLIQRDAVNEELVEVDPTTVAWEIITPETFDYTIKQDAGAGNVLGKVKFQLPDNQSIYLHDTVAKKFFARDYRALSHGCIRVAQPMALVYFLMDGTEGWDKKRIDRAYASTEQRYVKITPVPAHTVYMTAWVDENGALRFADDIYNMNGKLIR